MVVADVPDPDPVVLTVAPVPGLPGAVSYEGPVEPLDWDVWPPEQGERPRVFIAGQQRLPGAALPDLRLMRRFLDAEKALRGARYRGSWVRLTVLAALGPTTDPHREDDIPWERHVSRLMGYCVGVALLEDPGDDTAAVAVERRIAGELGKPVRSLSEWLACPA